MYRREFLRSSFALGSTAMLCSTGSPLLGFNQSVSHAFHMTYAPHIGMFVEHAGVDPIAQIEFMADQGFMAFEDNGMRDRSIPEQERIARALTRRGMAMGVFVINISGGFGKPSFTQGDPEMRAQFLRDVRDSVDVAKRVNATWMTVVMGDLYPRLEIDYQTAHAIETLKQAAQIFESHGLVMVIEPLNRWDHPGMYLSKIPQAYMLCKAIDSPSCKILFDIYHQQITEGNLIPNIDMAWDEIAYFQIGDNPGRNEPTTGEINYRRIFEHIYNKGYRGILGMEHGNSQAGRAGEQAVIDAYRAVDDF